MEEIMQLAKPDPCIMTRALSISKMRFCIRCTALFHGVEIQLRDDAAPFLVVDGGIDRSCGKCVGVIASGLAHANICGPGTAYDRTQPAQGRPKTTLDHCQLAGCKLRCGDVMQYGKINNHREREIVTKHRRLTACSGRRYSSR